MLRTWFAAVFSLICQLLRDLPIAQAGTHQPQYLGLPGGESVLTRVRFAGPRCVEQTPHPDQPVLFRQSRGFGHLLLGAAGPVTDAAQVRDLGGKGGRQVHR